MSMGGAACRRKGRGLEERQREIERGGGGRERNKLIEM